MVEFGLTRHVLVTVVNSAAGLNQYPTTLDSQSDDPETFVYLSAQRALRSTNKNKYRDQDIIKEAFDPQQVPTVVQAFGLVGANFNEYTAFKRSNLDNPVGRNEPVRLNEEVVLIRNELLPILREIIAQSISRHRIIPARKS